jgi:arsenite/tail-anchored protein-transporting ATPase
MENHLMHTDVFNVLRAGERLPRHLFFTGKGGVGKTSLACAIALALADGGKRVLIVSTDPASNLQHVFDCDIDTHTPTPIKGATKLSALNLDPEAAARAYRDRVVGPVRGLLPEETIREMEENLSGACTTEIAAFDEFTALLTDPATTKDFDHVVFDTAPTGHTLRLLSLPNAWSGFLAANTTGTSCLGPLAGLEKQQRQYKDAVDSLARKDLTALILVSLAQYAALRETARTSTELANLGIHNQKLILNGVLPDDIHTDDPLTSALRQREHAAIVSMPESLRKIPQTQVPLQPWNLIGLAALRALLQPHKEATPAATPAYTNHDQGGASSPGMPLCTLVDQLEQGGPCLIMTMGKGGVGKTTIAAAIAVELASRGHEVNLTTTDPAAHVTQTVGGEQMNLHVSRIDPIAETEAYRRKVLADQESTLDAAARALLEEDLRSPCTEEIAVFHAFSKAIQAADHRFVVMDTAPTGHTLLLLDATGAYHRETQRHRKGGREQSLTPMMRLQDPAKNKILIVTLPETTPVLEAAALQEDLRRAQIEPWGWVINASLAAAGVTNPFLQARAHTEWPRIEEVRAKYASRSATVPLLPDEPAGPDNLRQLTQGIFLARKS